MFAARLSLHRPRIDVVVRLISILLLFATGSSLAAEQFYDAAFRVEVKAKRDTFIVELKLSGERLPSKLEFHIEPARHRAFKSTDTVTTSGKTVVWQPRGKESRLTYEFIANHERSAQRYDSLVTADWAIFRGERLVPRTAVTGRKNLEARTTLAFSLPAGWSAAAPYPQEGAAFEVSDPGRKFDRPGGWMIVGKLGKRSEIIKGIQTTVAAPAGESTRRQDILAFLNWNLPHLKDVFPKFPQRILIVSAGDPMWRGGISGPASLFLHSDRPLVSENRTSTLLHELVHVAMGIRGDEESDWIVEGLAEYYSMEILRRSGGVGRARYDQALERMNEWAKRAPNVFVSESTGASTARAVMAFRAADLEIRKLSGEKSSLDDVAGDLAKNGGKVSLQLLQTTANKFAGSDVPSLHRQRLSAPLSQRVAP